MKKIKLLLILTVLMTCTGCQYSGMGGMVLGPAPWFSVDTRWDGTIKANPIILGFRVPTLIKFGFGAEGIKDVMGPPPPLPTESTAKEGETN